MWEDHSTVAQKHSTGWLFSHSSSATVMEQWLYGAGNFMTRVSGFEQSAETFAIDHSLEFWAPTWNKSKWTWSSIKCLSDITKQTLRCCGLCFYILLFCGFLYFGMEAVESEFTRQHRMWLLFGFIFLYGWKVGQSHLNISTTDG